MPLLITSPGIISEMFNDSTNSKMSSSMILSLTVVFLNPGLIVIVSRLLS